MEYYNFCKQYKNHFTIYGATGPNQIRFTTSFFWDQINFRWQQYKRKLEGENLVPIYWDKFKAFFHKALDDFQAFVDSY